VFTKDKKLTPVSYASETTSGLIHGRQSHPSVCVRRVALQRVEHLIAAKAADHINLACYYNKKYKELGFFYEALGLVMARFEFFYFPLWSCKNLIS